MPKKHEIKMDAIVEKTIDSKIQKIINDFEKKENQKENSKKN